MPGDFATIDADGRITLLGRGSQCINTGGEKVFPEEVEEAMKTHPDVLDAVAVGVPDEKFGEAVTGMVEARPGHTVDAASVIAHVKTTLAAFKAPKHIVVVDTIGRAANGKVDYKRLRGEATDARSELTIDPNVSTPIDSIDDAIAAMDREVDRCLECGDVGGYFTVVYRAVTERVRNGIAAGDFADGEQMEHFDVLFAQRYLDARDAWNAHSDAVPESWRLAFETAQSGRCLVAQHLLLGINAHINLDLGVAAAAAAPPGEVEALARRFRNDQRRARRARRSDAGIAGIGLTVDALGRRRGSAIRRGGRHLQPPPCSRRSVGLRDRAQLGVTGRTSPTRSAA